MINVRLYKTKAGVLYGFEVKNHGKSIVCAAVSVLVLNTVNSIERFTKDQFVFDYNESGGYINFIHPVLKTGGDSHDAALLLNSMSLGLHGINDEYKNEIKIITEVSHELT